MTLNESTVLRDSTLLHHANDSVIAAKVTALPVVRSMVGNNPQFNYWVDVAIRFGLKVLAAIVIFIVGRLVIKLLLRILRGFMDRRHINREVSTFISSATKIILLVLLFLAVISKLGIEVVSFTALLASAGVAIGMAMSSDLKNFAGGVVLLVTRPIRVGDFIESQGILGTVEEIQIFHTILCTPDNKRVYLPNGTVSGNPIINYSMHPTRRLQWNFGVEYDTDIDVVRTLLIDLLRRDDRVLPEPEPIITIDKIDSSSVDVLVRVWCNREDYWDLYWDFNRTVYKAFNERSIAFSFPIVKVKK